MTPYSETACDILSAIVADCAGLESFIPTPYGINGYAQTNLLDRPALEKALAEFPLPDVKVTCRIEKAEDKNWNEEWEKNSFKPLWIDGRIYIHADETVPEVKPEFDIRIDPHQAFGTGNHQTTSMILSYLADCDLTGLRILDAGCGTGIIGLFCALKGAAEVTGYDIDNWSVRNTLENIRLNHVSCMEVLEGDASLLEGMPLFDLVAANINRNILLNDMPSFNNVLNEGGKLILSGFYTEDISLLEEKANKLNLKLQTTCEKDHWAMLIFSKE
ncbi:MAG TPA: 50S ribosomal protein L11 methyltransferase [Candidatus Paraprevotella stercorigallinarum]|nr:50S ribosomal protein L11 methyltransferase [Candidatus Paraprevotella stercorigallinarum]